MRKTCKISGQNLKKQKSFIISECGKTDQKIGVKIFFSEIWLQMEIFFHTDDGWWTKMSFWSFTNVDPANHGPKRPKNGPKIPYANNKVKIYKIPLGSLKEIQVSMKIKKGTLV